MLPTKPRGVPRVDDRRVLNGIFWVLRSGAPWRDVPALYGPRTTCYNRFVRWRRAGIWERIMQALTAAHVGAVLPPIKALPWSKSACHTEQVTTASSLAFEALVPETNPLID